MPLTTGVSMKASGVPDGLGIMGHCDRDARVGCRDARDRERPGRQGGLRREEPGTIVPPAEGVHVERVGRVLVGHVDMGEPEIAVPAVKGRVPGGVGGAQLGGLRDEGLVLDDQGDQCARSLPTLSARLAGLLMVPGAVPVFRAVSSTGSTIR